MPSLRHLLLPASLGPILLLMGAMYRQPARSASGPAPLPSNADANASAAFEQALRLVGPDHVSWIDLKLWQRVNVRGLSYEAEGRFRAGPDQRMRLDLQTRVGEAVGTARVVCDGTTLWHAKHVGGTTWGHITKIDLAEMRKTLKPQGILTPGANPLLQNYSFAGIYPLLASLQQQITWVRREDIRRGDAEYIKLTGVWREPVAQSLMPDGQPWPEGLARQCRLYLHPDTYWPVRLEWWGPDAPRIGEVPLLQMEFREPRLNEPLSAEQCAELFHFDPGPADVADLTTGMAEQLRQHLNQQSEPAP